MADGGYAVPMGANGQLAPLPWSNIDQIQIGFDTDVDVQQTSLALSGVNVANYSFVDFRYDAATHTATWTLSSPIKADTLHIDLEVVRARLPPSTPLPGISTSPSMSCRGTQIKMGSSSMAWTWACWRNNWLHKDATAGDINGDGIVNGSRYQTRHCLALAGIATGGERPGDGCKPRREHKFEYGWRYSCPARADAHCGWSDNCGCRSRGYTFDSC